MGRSKKKPDYDVSKIDQELLDNVSKAYTDILKHSVGFSSSDDSSYRLIEIVAEDFNMSPMKMRKLLITAGVYKNDTSELIGKLKSEGKTLQEIQSITGLSRSSVNGYLPYSKVIYKNTESSVGADRIKLYRTRQKCLKELQKELTEEKLWECMILYQDFLFHTVSGLPFKYKMNIGRKGEYTKEIIINRRQESKTLTWSSVILAFNNAIKKKGNVIEKPKALGDIRGVSYIYPILYEFGVIDVPESAAIKMNNGKRLKNA